MSSLESFYNKLNIEESEKKKPILNENSLESFYKSLTEKEPIV